MDCNKMCSSYPVVPIEGKNSSSFNTYCVDLHKIYHKKIRIQRNSDNFGVNFFLLLFLSEKLHHPHQSTTCCILSAHCIIP